MIANLTEINDQGMDAFLAHQTDTYTCRDSPGAYVVFTVPAVSPVTHEFPSQENGERKKG